MSMVLGQMALSTLIYGVCGLMMQDVRCQRWCSSHSVQPATCRTKGLASIWCSEWSAIHLFRHQGIHAVWSGWLRARLFSSSCPDSAASRARSWAG